VVERDDEKEADGRYGHCDDKFRVHVDVRNAVQPYFSQMSGSRPNMRQLERTSSLPINVYRSRESTDSASSQLWKMAGKAISKSTADQQQTL
jgi:hypothetical protein